MVTPVQLSTANTMLNEQAIALLQRLISIPSYSRQEQGTADYLCQWFQSRGVKVNRHKNNVWVTNRYYDAKKPGILLNSHHDTVKPAAGYTKDPFAPYVEDGKLYGLGSNDAGGALVSLIGAFMHFYEQPDLPFNIVLAATAEEEISGTDGIESILAMIGNVQCAIVGEPTKMQMAIAEKGLMVIDCEAEGTAGHAAREEGVNAIYKAIKDIDWIQNYKFDKVSDLLGPVKMTVTVIDTPNKSHNVVPASCHFVADIRVNELYTFKEVTDILSANLQSSFTPRSTRLRSSIIDTTHPLVQAGIDLGGKYYGSPTTSDKALMPFPALKIGPGDSARSHIADEFIYVNEIEEGIELYIQLLQYFFMSESKQN